MNKVININFQGRILPIEEQAYEILKQYIASLRSYFENEEGRDEIINDIECRVAELCDDKLKKGEVCINENTINLIIESIGRPADFEAQDGFEKTNTTPSNAQYSNEHNENMGWESNHPKRLYRDEQNKVLGGVCSGIANYFNLDPLLVRVLWIFLIGVNILGYLILWIAVPSSSVKEVGGVRKRLFRDIDNKIIGGVCAGLSKYFGIRVGIVRLLFMIPFIRFIIHFRHFHLFQFWDSPDFPNFLDFTFSPGAIFVYIVLWLVLPEAKTSADKLEMVGEKVDINSIKNTIQNDMEGFGKRAQAWGSEFYKRNAERKYERAEKRAERRGAGSSEPTEGQGYVAPENNKGCLHFIGRIITICVKVFVYFILGIIGISLLAALFGIGVAGTSLLPLKGFLLEDGMQTASFIGTILFFVWVPIIAIVTAIIRKIAGFKKSNKWVRTGFISLWVLGWVCIFYFGSSLGNSFSKHNIPNEENIQLTNAKVDLLELTASPKMKYYEDKWFQITPFSSFSDEDTVFVRNLRVRIVQSKTDSFEVKIVKLSNGKSVQEANALAKKINFTVTQEDSLLYLDRGISINKNEKFRNQHIIMTIAVPVGKRILITNKGWSQTNVRIDRRGMRSETIDRVTNDSDWFDEWNEPWDSESYSYEQGVEYKMTTTGLEKIRRTNEAMSNEDEDAPEDIEEKLQKLKEERLQLEQNLEKSKAEKLHELEKIDKALDKQKEKAGKSTEDRKDKKVVVAPAKEINTVTTAASKLADIHWVLERFSY
jgi:phage shock protein PspC (stress-responsive transcriptional regulator)